MKEDLILLAHGGGGLLTQELVEEIMLPAFKNAALAARDDGALVQISGAELVFSTDAYVVKPRFFPGGDIGKLAVCGTVNDIAVCGAKPLYLSAAFIIEEGFSRRELSEIVASMAQAAKEAGVQIVTGDTKVVERGNVDGIYITTAGIGQRLPGISVSGSLAKAGQDIILSGSLGEHAMTVMAQRHGLTLPEEIHSDCAPLNGVIEELLQAVPQISVLRDVTRGGLATTLHEIAEQSGVALTIREEAIAVRPAVRAAADLLGFDPLYLANEGKFLICVESIYSQRVVDILQQHAKSGDASIIGTVGNGLPGRVVLKTLVGGERILDMPLGDLLPRIC